MAVALVLLRPFVELAQDPQRIEIDLDHQARDSPLRLTVR